MNAITDYICSEVDLPMCRYISDNVCNCTSRYEMFGNVKLYSPTLLGLILSNIGIIYFMIDHVNKLCSCFGRTEMRFFYQLFALSNIIQMVLLVLKNNKETFYFALTFLHLVVNNMCFVSLLVGSYTQEMLISKYGINSRNILYLFTASYGFISAIILFFSLALKYSLIVFFISFLLNFIIGYIYYVVQFRKLNRLRAEIWAYGTILMSMMCFLISSGFLFINSTFIAILTDKYLDNLFFHNLFIMCAVVMIHKYWISVFDYELESLLLDV